MKEMCDDATSVGGIVVISSSLCLNFNTRCPRIVPVLALLTL